MHQGSPCKLNQPNHPGFTWTAHLLIATILVFSSGTPFAWGQRNLKDIPDSDPEIERKSFILADGFEVNLFAGDPQIAKPIHMNFDERGRLWVAGSSVYPHIQPGKKANDKILILEDTNGDGKSDKTTVFADGLLIPTGVAPAPGGCYVANSTELIHLIDTDGDGKADQKKIILSGFGTEDTHHILHSLRWGHDGCLYMNQSIYIHSHIETPYGVKRLNAGGIWRFRPETLELEVLCEGFVNPWGHHFDYWGQNFATDGAYGEGINYVFPGSVFVTAYKAKRVLKGLNPGSPKHCGLEILSGRHLPAEFQGNMITNDFRANRVCRFVVTENGTSAFSSRQETELIKTKHIAFRPIDVKMGPDGAIYIADWYNPIIQHGEVDFRDPRRDHVHGRIWRLTYKGNKTLNHPDLTNSSTAELLQQLTAPENWVRLHAKRLLKQRSSDVVSLELKKWLTDLDPKSPEYNHHRLEALWAYQSIRVVNQPLLNELLKNQDHRVRAAALRVAREWKDHLANPQLEFADAINDSHPRVRLEGVRGLSLFPKAESASKALKVLDRPMDPYLDFALWKTLRELKESWVPQLVSGRFQFDNNLDHLTFALKAADSPAVVQPLFNLANDPTTSDEKRAEVYGILASLGNAQQLGMIAEKAIGYSKTKPEITEKIIRQLANLSRQRSLVPDFDRQRLVALIDHSSPSVSDAAVLAAGIWKIEEAREKLSDLATLGNLNAIDSVALLGGEKSKSLLGQLATDKIGIEIRQRATNVLSLVDIPLAAKKAVALLKESPAQLSPQATIDFLLKTKGGPQALVKELAKVQLDAEIAKLAVRSAQSSPTPNQNLLQAFRKAGNLDAAKWTPSPALTKRLLGKIKSEGNPRRGELVYRRPQLQCLKCHAIGGAGGVVGPEMNSIGASAQVDYLIESLLEPNKKVKENYHSVVVQTVDGLQFSGVPIRQTDSETVLRTAEGKVITISADDIEGKKDGRSLMPAGLVDSLTETEIIDLVAFLSSLGKVGEFAIGNRQYSRNWETLVWTKEANQRLNRTSLDTAAVDDPALTWREEIAMVNGSIDLSSLPEFKLPHSNVPKTSFLRTILQVDVAGTVTVLLEEPTGIQLWIDGKPTKTQRELTLELAAGDHQLVLAVDKSAERQARLELLAKQSTAARWK